jgi:membrane-associated phospholipid phosphatase
LKNIDNLIVVIIFVFSILAGYFALNDLNISETIVNQQSTWAEFLQKYGELPGAFVIIFGIFIFSIHFKNSSFVISAGIQFILALALSSILLYISFILLSNFTDSSDAFFNYAPFLFAGFFILTLSAVLTLRKMELTFSHSLIVISKVILGMTVFGYLFSNQIIKIFWGRVRYRNLDILHSDFTEWYIANGINGYQSFPSGHAAMGWMLLPLFLLAINKNYFIKSIVIGIISIWAISVAVSRVVIGAHYASDVLFGSFFMIISFLVFYKKFVVKDEVLRKELK